MTESLLNLDSIVLEDIIDKTRDKFSASDTPIRVKNLLDYFDSEEERVILGPLRNHSMLIELVGFILFPYSQGHHSERLASYFRYYLTHRTRCTIHRHDLEIHIERSLLEDHWKRALLEAINQKK